jgi:hypothetical protein
MSSTGGAKPSGDKLPLGGVLLSPTVLGLGAAFLGGYAIAYFYGPLPNLDDLREAVGLKKDPVKEFAGDVRTPWC